MALDPLAVQHGPGLAFVYQSARRFEEAVTECRKSLDLDPNQLLALWIRGISYCHLGKHAEAIADLEKATNLTPDSYYSGCLAYAYARAGRTDDAIRVVGELAARSASEYVAPPFFVWAYGALGRIDRAYDFLEKAFAERHPLVVPLSHWQIYDTLRTDSRFAGYSARIQPEA